jgi:DNA-cytosine methyltransferase
MNILSLFDGMSVAQQALKDAGIPVGKYFASEIDQYAVAVTQANYPETVQLGSVVGLELHQRIDLMIGGSPCQDLSIAKMGREGLAGSRSGLFWEYVRIRDEIKPTYFILENVASMPREAKNTISEALGVEPVMINASLVSAQNRKRLFWVGKWNGEKYEQVEIPQPEDRGILLKDILESEVDESFYVSNKTLNSLKNWNNAQAGRIRGIENKSVTLQAGGGGTGAKTGLYAIKSNYNNTINYDKANTLGSNSQCQTAKTGQGLVDFKKQIIRKLTPTECLRLQSMPDDYFNKATYKNKAISNTQRYKMCGNAFNKEVIVHILKQLK